MFCIIVTVVAFFPFCFFMPAFGVHSQRTISWMRLFANITQVFNFFLLFFGAFFLAFSTYSSWRTSRMGRRRCLMRWLWSTSSRRCLTKWSWRTSRMGRRRCLTRWSRRDEDGRWKKRSPTYPSLKCKAISKKRYR